MNTNMTLGEITTEDYRSAVVFKKYGLDFCCGGKKTLAKACEEKGLDSDDMIEELKANSTISRPEQNYSDWKINFLIDYIINTHHVYVRKNLPIIRDFLTKTVNKHSDRHPELVKILYLFTQVYQELLQHMQKEEEILFPVMKNLEDKQENKGINFTPKVGSIKGPITMMEQEHEDAGNAFQLIHSLSNNLTPPEDACKTYKITYAMLNEFEENLHLHIHLENNILFPKALSFEE